MGRVVHTDPARGLEVYEYVTDRDDDLDVWFAHPGRKVLYVADGHLLVEIEGRPPGISGRATAWCTPARSRAGGRSTATRSCGCCWWWVR